MARPLFDRLCDPSTLKLAWEKVRGNNGCAGGDGQSVVDFDLRADFHLARLSEVLAKGHYNPGPLRRHEIAKSDGGIRPLVIPSVSDRIVQTAVAQLITPLAEPTFSTASFGYRPGRSVNMAIDRVSALRSRGLRWVVDADIERAFENVPQAEALNRLQSLLRGHDPDRQLLDLVALWLEQQGTEAGTPGKGLAQGSPLSPLLFNLVLDGLDDAFEDDRAAIVRFADDFLILTASEADAQAARDRAGAWLARHGLRLGEDDTRVVTFEDGFAFLGRLFVRSLVLQAPDEDDPEAAEDMRRLALADTERTTPIDAVPDDTYDPGGRVLYLIEAGRRLSVQGGAVSVTSGDGREVLRLARHRVGRIELGPGIIVEAETLRSALAEGIPIAFVDGRGLTMGQLWPSEGGDGALHLAQAAAVLDEDRRYAIAAKIVEARLRTIRARLSVLNRTRKADELTQAGAKIGGILRQLANSPENSIESLRGQEAHGAALWWPALASLVPGGEGFRRRRGEEAHLARGTEARLNLLFDAAAAMLTRDVRAAVQRVGLHPGMGFLHGQGGEGLVWDLMEPWRAVVAESTVVTLFLRNRVADADFIDNGRRVRLAPSGVRALVAAYEEAMAIVAKSEASGKRHTTRRRILEDARAFARHLRDPSELWSPSGQDY